MIKTIVIDDDLDTAETFANILMMKDIKVLDIALNGEKGFESYKEFHPDVVLMDVMMPESDGFDGLEKIRNYDPDAKVIIVTADFRSDTEERLIDQHASAIIYKPYDIEQVIKTIHEVYEGTFELS